MKKFLIVLMVISMASFLFTGCIPTAPTEVAVTGVTLDEATMTLTAGGATGTLVATVAPADATDPRVTWASSDEAVATVAAGVVTPLTAGIADITVTTVDGGFTATCEVTVSAAPVAVTGVTLDEATLALTVGDAAVTLVATVAPATATDTSVIWASSDETVAIVAAGVVTPLNAGISAITVTTVDGGFVATCVVTVAADEEPLVTQAPVITEIVGIVFSDDTHYINSDESELVVVSGIALPLAEIKIYIDGEHVATAYSSMFGEFSTTVIDPDDLGDDGEKTIYATAELIGLAESAPSTVYAFTLDTERPAIDTAAFDLSATTVTVTFDEDVDETNAELHLTTWTLSHTVTLTPLALVEAELTSSDVVVLTYTTGAELFGEVFTVTCVFVATPVEDLAGNAMIADSVFVGFIMP